MTNDNGKDILISIVIVNYKVPYCLMEALSSLRLAELYDRCEVIVVDNASGDGSCDIVTAQFNEVHWIQLKTNIGFGKACNVGVEAARGEYLLLLNPDTIITSNTLSDAVKFMEAHPKAGLVGPKILNPDGTLQLSCRRSIPTPSVAFYYFAGLSWLFPKSKRFGRYHLTYMDEDETAQVDVISGSFMFMRRALFNGIGGFDRRFFMYGEDIDLCYRISKAGYEVWYCPQIKIVHQKGKSSSKRLIRSRIYFYEAMIIFSRKYRDLRETYFPGWLMWAGIMFQAVLNIGAILARSLAAVAIDFAVISAALWAGLSPLLMYLGEQTFYAAETPLRAVAVHALAGLAFVALFAYNGIYSARQYRVKNALFSGLLSSALFMSGVYFLSEYSLAGFGAAFGLSILLTILWREALPLVVKGIRGRIFAPELVLVVGHGRDIHRHIKDIEERRGTQIAGIILLGRPERESGGQIEGYPVIGNADSLPQALDGGKIDALLIVAARPWYSEIINILVQHRNKGIDIHWEAIE